MRWRRDWRKVPPPERLGGLKYSYCLIPSNPRQLCVHCCVPTSGRPALSHSASLSADAWTRAEKNIVPLCRMRAEDGKAKKVNIDFEPCVVSRLAVVVVRVVGGKWRRGCLHWPSFYCGCTAPFTLMTRRHLHHLLRPRCSCASFSLRVRLTARIPSSSSSRSLRC